MDCELPAHPRSPALTGASQYCMTFGAAKKPRESIPRLSLRSIDALYAIMAVMRASAPSQMSAIVESSM